MKSEGVTNPQTGKWYFLKYRYHLGPFSFKILYSRCIFVKQSRVIFSNTRFKKQWLKVAILRKPGNWLHRDVWFSWHCGGSLGHINKMSPLWELNWGGQVGQREDAQCPPLLCTCLMFSGSAWAPQDATALGSDNTRKGDGDGLLDFEPQFVHVQTIRFGVQYPPDLLLFHWHFHSLPMSRSVDGTLSAWQPEALRWSTHQWNWWIFFVFFLTQPFKASGNSPQGKQPVCVGGNPFKKIYGNSVRKGRVCSVWTKTKVETPLQMAAVRHTGLLLCFQSEGFSQEEQVSRSSHHATKYLLWRVSPRRVWLGHGGSLLRRCQQKLLVRVTRCEI